MLLDSNNRLFIMILLNYNWLLYFNKLAYILEIRCFFICWDFTKIATKMELGFTLPCLFKFKFF